MTTVEDLFDLAELKAAAKGELDRRQAAQVYLRDPYMFQKYVLCDPKKRIFINELHRDGLKFINGPKRRKGVLWPRGHLKSTVLTQGETLRRALLVPNIRILLSSQKVEMAKSFLLGIKGSLQKPEFQRLYGNLLPDTKQKILKNNDYQLTLTNRTDYSIREATFTCTGPDAEKTSQHYDLIVHDDVVGRETVTNTQQIEKSIQYYKDCIFLLDPPKPGLPMTEIWVIGTRWHPLDMYGWLIAGATDPRCRERRFLTHVDGCMCKMDWSIRSVKEDGKYIWPEVFNDEYLDELIIADGLDHYSVACQYYNNPTDPSTCWFKVRDLEKAKMTPTEMEKVKSENKNLVWYVALDPAESEQARSCLSAAVAVAVDHTTGDWYVDWADGRHVDTPGFCDLAMEAWRRYHPQHFGMEIHTKRGTEYALRQRMIQTNTLFSIEELKPNRIGDAQRSKESRVKQLVALFEFGKMHVRSDLKDLWDEFYTLPSAIHWDLADALSYVMDMVPAGVGGHNGKIHTPRPQVHWKNIGY